MEILVDTSIWIDYFRSGDKSEKLDFLIEENLLVINDLVLTELLPFLVVKKEKKVIDLLKKIKQHPVQKRVKISQNYYYSILLLTFNKNVTSRCVSFVSNIAFVLFDVYNFLYQTYKSL